MKEPDEQMLKDMYAMQADSRLAQGGCRGLDNGAQLCKAPSLRERIEGQAQAAEYQGMKGARLRELSALLNKHPEVARILELMNEVRD